MMGGRLLREGQIELVILEIFEELVENPKVISSLCSPLFSSVPSYLSFTFFALVSPSQPLLFSVIFLFF